MGIPEIHLSETAVILVDVDEKYKWVDQNLGSRWVERVILTRDKTLISGDILIDDRPKLEGLRQPVWEHIIFDQPYNREVLGV